MQLNEIVDLFFKDIILPNVVFEDTNLPTLNELKSSGFIYLYPFDVLKYQVGVSVSFDTLIKFATDKKVDTLLYNETLDDPTKYIVVDSYAWSECKAEILDILITKWNDYIEEVFSKNPRFGSFLCVLMQGNLSLYTRVDRHIYLDVINLLDYASPEDADDYEHFDFIDDIDLDNTEQVIYDGNLVSKLFYSCFKKYVDNNRIDIDFKDIEDEETKAKKSVQDKKTDYYKELYALILNQDKFVKVSNDRLRRIFVGELENEKAIDKFFRRNDVQYYFSYRGRLYEIRTALEKLWFNYKDFCIKNNIKKGVSLTETQKLDLIEYTIMYGV